MNTTPNTDRSNNTKSTGKVAAAAALCGIAVAGTAAALIMTFGGSASAHHVSPASPAGNSSSSSSSSSSQHHKSAPVLKPSPAIETLQRQLGQLNYYEGPIDGIAGPQTFAAIADLQRQAGLPQTGQLNTATNAALHHFLTHGNNQMGS